MSNNIKNPLVDGFTRTPFDELSFPQEIQTRFDIIERIGHNESGDTFIMSEKSTRDFYVMKSQKIRETISGNEAELLSGLIHEGLPSFDTPIENDDTRYLLRKYIKGETLDEYLAGKETSDSLQAVDYMISLCEVLIYLHSQQEPIIHRDIKPSNIVVNTDSKSITLIDFGISRKYSENAEYDTTYFGTHKFAPPEQYGFAQTDTRTDIFSIGVLMRYWLTGSTDQKVKIPDKELEKIAAKCSELAPESRFQSAAALKKALLRYKSRSKRRLYVILAGIISSAAVLVSAFFIGSHLFYQEDIPPIPVVTPTPDAVSTPLPPAQIPQTPEGLNNNDYQKIVAFLFYEDNLSKVMNQNSDFDIYDINTWERWERGGYWTDDEGNEHPTTNFITWKESRIKEIFLFGLGLTGNLDVSGFTNLYELDVAQNNLTGIDVSGCTSLRYLHINDNKIANLNLSDNLSLVSLTCQDNLLTALDLSGLYRLRDVDYSNNPIIGEVIRSAIIFVEPLIEKAVRLFLHLDDDAVLTVYDLSLVEEIYINYDRAFSNIHEFHENYNNAMKEANHIFENVDMSKAMSSLEDLRMLPSLKRVHITTQPFTDISILAELPELRILDMDFVPVEDLSPLRGLQHLQDVAFSFAPFSDISALTGLPSLTRFHVWACPNINIRQLRDFQHLTELTIEHRNSHSYRYLPDLPFVHLNIGSSEIDSFRWFEASKSTLRVLGIGETRFTSLDGIDDFKNLEVLYLINTLITDLTPLLSLPNLKTLYLDIGQMHLANNIQSRAQFEVIPTDYSRLN